MEESLKPEQHYDFNALKNEINDIANLVDKNETSDLYKRAKLLHESLLNTKFYDLISANLSIIALLEYKQDIIIAKVLFVYWRKIIMKL